MLDSLKVCLASKFGKLLESCNCMKKTTEKSSSSSSFDLRSSWIESFATSMEFSTQLKHVFRLIDLNGDGKISSLELKQLLLNMGHEKTTAAKEAEIMVEEMDCNGDGYVDFDEFMSVMEIDDQKRESEHGINRMGYDQSTIVEAFRVFDADNDGLISAKELKKVLGRLGFGNCSVRECRKMIKGVDKDGDGYVNFEEFKCMMSTGC